MEDNLKEDVIDIFNTDVIIEEDINSRIDILEAKLNNFLIDPDKNDPSEITTQISTIEYLLKFYDISNVPRFNDLKIKFYTSDYSIYNYITEDQRLTKINQDIENIVNLNTHIQERVLDQNKIIDDIGLFMLQSDNAVVQSNEEILNYHAYLQRKNRFYRIVIILSTMFLILLIYKIIK